MIFNVTGGGAGSGGTLVVTAPTSVTVTITKDGKTKSKIVDQYGYATFKGLETGDWTVTITSGSKTSTQTVSIVADYAITMAFFAATIAVTYPEGSTLTCSDGITTLKATTTTGTYTFNIPYAGTWEVKCTLDSSTASKSVSITTSGQAESVTLTYGLYLYDNGSVSGYTWTCKDDLDSQQAKITNKSTYMELYGGENAYTLFYSKNKIDVSEYKTLKMTLTNADMTLDDDGIYFGLSSSTRADGTGMSTKTIYREFSGSKEMSVDISKVTTSQYVALFVSTPPGGEFSARVTKIWLE